MSSQGRVALHKTSFLLVAFAMGLALMGAKAPQEETNPARGKKERAAVKIRVRVADKISWVRIRGFDLNFSKIIENYKNDPLRPPKIELVSNTHRLSHWKFQCENGNVRALRVNRSGQRINTAKFDFKGPLAVFSPVGVVALGGVPYRDELVIHPKGDRCDVVNHVKMDRYLDSLIQSEFNPLWHPESIPAQVIAARTYAYYQMRSARIRGKHFDLESSIVDQVYEGFSKEHYKASQSVRKTRGIVLVGKKHPIKAFYHSTCGGKTELPQNVWGKKHHAFRGSVKCKYCQNSPQYRWKIEMGAKFLKRTILWLGAKNRLPKNWPKDWHEIVSQGELKDIKVANYSNTGRAKTLKLDWGKDQLFVPAVKFRSWLGSNRIKSTRFGITRSLRPNGKPLFSFRGRGHGHGVGMCQWGAKRMGEKGFQAASILKHYYPKASLQKIW